MMLRQFRCLLLGVSAALGLAASANAAVVSREFVLSPSDFVNYCCAVTPTPVDPVTLDFKVQFDNNADVAPTTSGLTVVTFNLADPIEYSYLASTDTLTVASDIPGPASCNPPANSFCAFIDNATGAAPTLIFFQQVTSSYGTWRANTLSLSYIDTSAVPEPATWAMMLIGFGGAGAAMRRRRNRQALA